MIAYAMHCGDHRPAVPISRPSALSRVLPVLRLPAFLDRHAHSQLLNHFLANDTEYRSSVVRNIGERGTANVDDSLRRSRSCALPDALTSAIWKAVAAKAPLIAHELGLDIPAGYGISGHGAAHGHGDFFRPHRDIDTRGPRDRHRLVSVIWYCHRQPRAFSGGALRLYSLDLTRFTDVEPCDNMAVFFPSFVPHEVREVDVPSRAFADSRFAYAGWILRPPKPARRAE